MSISLFKVNIRTSLQPIKEARSLECISSIRVDIDPEKV